MKYLDRKWLVIVCLLLVALTLLPDEVLAYSRRGFERDLQHLLREGRNFLHHPPTWAKVTFCSVGAIALVYGYAIYRFLVMIPGIIIGGLIGFGIGAMEWGNVGGILLGIFGASFGGGLAWLLHQLLIWLIGAVAGGALTAGISYGLFDTEPNILVVIVVALLGGSLLLFISKSIVVVKTSALGSLLVCFGSGKYDSPVLMLLLFLAGMAMQFGLSRWILATSMRTGQAVVGAAGAAGAAAVTAGKGREALTGEAPPELSVGLSRQQMLQTLEENQSRVVDMLQQDSPLEEILAYFFDTHAIPQQVTRAYLVRLVDEQV